jgi:hypothetical protein
MKHGPGRLHVWKQLVLAGLRPLIGRRRDPKRAGEKRSSTQQQHHTRERESIRVRIRTRIRPIHTPPDHMILRCLARRPTALQSLAAASSVCASHTTHTCRRPPAD